jgi:hypothetical protein
MDDSEWMCPLTWNMPPNAVVLPPLQALSEATGDDQDNDFHSDARYVIASAYVGLLVRDLAEELPRDIWLRGSKKKINVGAGFDEGEPVLMGTLSPKGLALRNPAT